MRNSSQKKLQCNRQGLTTIRRNKFHQGLAGLLEQTRGARIVTGRQTRLLIG